METLGGDLVERGVEVAIAGGGVAGAIELPTLAAHPAVAPLLLAQSFYRLANARRSRAAMDPDDPPHLQKVTRTH